MQRSHPDRYIKGQRHNVRRVEKKGDLKVYYTNSRSLRNKIDLLRGKACVEEFDIIALTETWIDTGSKNFLSEYEIEGYQLFHEDREGRRGGGVAIYVRDTLRCAVNTSLRIDGTSESIWVDILKGREKLTVGVQYRPPNLGREDTNSLLQEIGEASRNRNVCILGGYNFRRIDWEGIVGDQESEAFLGVLQDNFLKQVVREPTRGENILDLVLTNNENMISGVDVGSQLGCSDHREIRFNLEWEANHSNNLVIVPDFRRANYEGLRRHLEEVNWEYLEVGDEGQEISVERTYNNLIKAISEGQELYIPYRPLRKENRDPKWMTQGLKHEIGLKRRLYKRIKNGENQLRTRYNELVRAVKRNTRIAKRNYEIKVAREAKSNPKGFFNMYRTKTRERIGPLKTEAGEIIESGEDMCKLLNDYFLSVFTRENQDTIPVREEVFQGEDNEKLRDVIITRQVVQKEIEKLKKNKSPGPDKVYPRILKECKEILSGPLTNVFRKSVDTSVVPSLWKEANVTPIFKKGDKSSTANYRPISLTSVVGKMLESIIARSIRDHLERHSLINDSQHGFTTGRSCLTNLLSFYKKVIEAVDQDQNYDVVYLDFSKAFDKVPHQRLLKKVEAHGIDGKVLKWIGEWLTCRKQRVQINGKKSEWGCVTSGVPQGSVLGPLLFIIYINDLDVGLSSDVSKFADDTKVGRVIRTEQDAGELQRDLEKLYEWTRKWQMEFNIGKCSVMSAGRNNPLHNYSLNDTPLGRSNCERDLGVRVSSDLRSRNQCLQAKNRANRVLGFISRSVSNRSAEVILKLYLALVRPHLDYAVQFWSPCYRMDINMLESVQRRMTKKIQGLRNLPYRERLRHLNLHSLERRRVRGDMIEVYKWMKGYNKGDINKVLMVREQGRTRSNGFKLDKFRFNKDIGKNWFTNRVVDEWNGLSTHVVSANTLDSFKRRLDKFMDGEDRW